MLRLSASDISAVLSCRRQYVFSLSGFVPKETPTALLFGSAIHDALDVFYSAGRDVESAVATFLSHASEFPPPLFTEEAQAYDELLALGEAMLRNYAAFSAVNDTFEVIRTEQRVEAPIYAADGEELGKLVGRVDGIVRTRDGAYWVLEHKTSSAGWSAEERNRDFQTLAYLYLASRTIDEPLTGVIWNILIKRKPEKPRVLKNGQLSRDKSQPTTYDLYREAIRELGLREEDYADVLEYLRTVGFQTFFQRDFVVRSTQELARFERYVQRILYELRSATPDWAIPNPSWRCAYCEYASLCRAVEHGDDTSILLQTLYTEVRNDDVTNFFRWVAGLDSR